ncbi:MAG: HYR domain-containing protein, partial [Bacteroidales bacterium]|nr:HYR domain-containing protein [Bacteroidales bacterium]
GGQGTYLYWSADGNGSSYYMANWSPGSLLDDSTSSGTVFASPTTTTLFTITLTDSIYGCEATDQITVNVSPDQVIPVDLGRDLTICLGTVDSIQIGIPPVPGHEYYWYPEDYLSDPEASNPWLYLSDVFQINYTLEVIDPSSQGFCGYGQDDISIYVSSGPEVSVSPDYSWICEDEAVTFHTDIYNVYPNAFEYRWYPPSAFTNPSIPDPTVIPHNPYNVYTLIVEPLDDASTKYIGCETSADVYVTVFPDIIPDIPAIGLDCGPATDRRLPDIQDNLIDDYWWEPSGLVLNSFFVGVEDTILTLHYYTIFGCEDTISVPVVFGDKDAPILICPGNTALSCNDDTSVMVNGWASCIDNCDSLPQISHTDRIVAGSCNHSYFIHRTWFAQDASGNLDSCLQVLTITDDNEPEVYCPPDLLLFCPADTTPGLTGSATATDACDPAPIISYIDQVLPDCGGTFTVERTWRATDECGNSAECVQTLTVQDTTAPLITCPGDVVLDCPADTTVGTNGLATATDECSGFVITHIDQVTYGCAHTFVVERTWRATDDCGNFSECIQTLTVQDTTPPLITCPNDTIVTADYGSCDDDVTVPAPQVSDECSDWTLFNDYNGTDNASDTYPAGTTLVTWTLTDDCGNASSCVQTIVVRNYPVAYDDDTIVPTGAIVAFPVLGNDYDCQGLIDEGCVSIYSQPT